MANPSRVGRWAERVAAGLIATLTVAIEAPDVIGISSGGRVAGLSPRELDLVNVLGLLAVAAALVALIVLGQHRSTIARRIAWAILVVWFVGELRL